MDWSSNTGRVGGRGGVVVSYAMGEGINFVPYKNGDVEQVLAEEGGGGWQTVFPLFKINLIIAKTSP